MIAQPLSKCLTQKTIAAAIETAPEWQIHDANPNKFTVIGQAGIGSAFNGRVSYSMDKGVTWTPSTEGYQKHKLTLTLS